MTDQPTDLSARTGASAMPESPGERRVQLFGRVTFIGGYALPGFIGCHALVELRDSPGKTIAVLTSEHRLQTLLETALTGGNLISFQGFRYTDPPTPSGGTWAVEVCGIDGINLYA